MKLPDFFHFAFQVCRT